MRGSLILVVGPSGAGKDSLIAAARMRFSGDDSLVFAQRCITRRPDPDGEAHEGVSQMEFKRRRDAGRFMLSWQAHGFWYGIPASYGTALESGRSVVANVSRTVVDQARGIFNPVSVMHVTASSEILARRLAARGREKENDRDARLKRTVDVRLDGEDVTTIVNDGTLAEAAALFVTQLRRITEPTAMADVSP